MKTLKQYKPILFRGEMVRAILDGKKTQTRRPLKLRENQLHPNDHDDPSVCCPYGQVGDRLWVRETWRPYEDPKTCIDGILFKADGSFREIENTREAADKWLDARGDKGIKVWRPSIFMPRWACRLELEIVKVRVEWLKDISDEDALAEGLLLPTYGSGLKPTPRLNFIHRFPEIHKQRDGWNPELWVLDFKRVTS